MKKLARFINTVGICPDCKQKKARIPSCGWVCYDCLTKVYNSPEYIKYEEEREKEMEYEDHHPK